MTRTQAQKRCLEAINKLLAVGLSYDLPKHTERSMKIVKEIDKLIQKL